MADIPVFAGIGLLGGAMLRDFAIVATAFEVDVVEARKAGVLKAVLVLVGGPRSWRASAGWTTLARPWPSAD